MSEYEIPTIQSEWDEILETRDCEQKGDYTIVIDDEVLLALEGFYMDFEIGKRIADVYAETPWMNVKMKCTKIDVSRGVLFFTGKCDGESFHLMY